jgi:hypothetical protein
MALYTILFTFRRKPYSFQVRSSSPTEAVADWIRSLDTRSLLDFGELSKQRLVQTLKQFGVNRVEGLSSVWQWHGCVSGFDGCIQIVETTEA